ncbi:hypothetical protein AWZ03_009027 [Drosophila navojoa]|uniref:Cyclin-dependent kinase inhibitor domain-containing protein n=1 Tax=Drosophila navojoa TaxID=7232 RepID=A0A484B9W6_DRONA|nr:uncharacterized protein LOC108653254 [Drosophila navojoa]TDG44555.1 hypothetical protein AWZ03_009027 [Drosophila navojoa]
MVSARMLHPVVLSEFCKMSYSPASRLQSPCVRQLDVNRIKRNLFGSVPLQENKPSFFSAELELQQERASQKWGFDFRADRPLASNASYNWQRVSSQESTFAPQMYTLTRAAHVRPAAGPTSDMDALLNDRADRENSANSSLDSSADTEYDSQDESLSFKCSSSSSISVVASTSAAALIASASSSATASTCSSPAQQRKRQLKITEFMKERKRLAQAPKKLSPAKRLRTSSGSSSSNANATSVGSLLKRTRHN